MIRIKTGVTPHNLVILAAAANIAQILDITLVVTSGTDGTHKTGSKHYSGDALDFRTVNLIASIIPAIIARLQRRLGPAYQVLLETSPPHIHVEYDPH